MKVYSKGRSTEGAPERSPAIASLLSKVKIIGKFQSTPTRSVDRPAPKIRAEDRQTELVEFFRLYESLVESVCDGAQLGVSAKLEERFQFCRMELINRYSSMRSFLSAYLRSSGEDARGTAHGIRFDAFDALLAPSSLELFLQADDGCTISRITRTREALNLYAEHLRQLTCRSR